MPDESLPHIFLRKSGRRFDYVTPPSGGGKAQIQDRDQEGHSQKLIRKLQQAWGDTENIEKRRTAISLPSKKGMYLEFKSAAGYDLVTKSLDDMKQGTRLLNVRTEGAGESEVTIATVYVPAGKESHFLKKVQDYATKPKNVVSNKPKNYKLVDSIEDIRIAVLESFWQDPMEYLPSEKRVWCEVWLRTGTVAKEAVSAIATFRALCDELGIPHQEEVLQFPERAIILIEANQGSLMELIESSKHIAEFRLAKETARFWVELSPKEQTEWVEDMASRIRVSEGANVAITILDSGVNNGHALLAPLLADEDRHTHNESWGVHDHHLGGHGTGMAGLAGYGDLQRHLEHSEEIEINHKLESVKILPASGNGNIPKEWGAITQQAISRVEIQAPERVHIGCMAVTSELETDRGRPSSWSGALDAMTSGYTSDPEQDDPKRLFIVSAGNVREEQDFQNYPYSNMIRPVENPGQSWNSLTVGAYTKKTQISAPDCQEHTVIAQAGCLSPYSTTSLEWELNKWPIKPDIVLEGGNRGRPPGQPTSNYEDLSLLTTHHEPLRYQFEIMEGTSAATGEAARMAAQIQAEYPNAWPETVRGLMIHSAEWTKELIKQFNIDVNKKSDVEKLLRICGYGVPDLRRATACASNRLTLIAQEYLYPFDKRPSGSGYGTKDMHIHELPWPKEVLKDLGSTQVTLRITLSYFIEPGPGNIGWKDRYRYASHALRFDLNAWGETRTDFQKRLNKAERDKEYDSSQAPDSGTDRWLIGSNNRKLGSVHSDRMVRNAVELASCNMIGVSPVIGWWRERHHLKRWNKRTRYSLIASLHTPEEDVDIYTPVATIIKTAIETSI